MSEQRAPDSRRDERTREPLTDEYLADVERLMATLDQGGAYFRHLDALVGEVRRLRGAPAHDGCIRRTTTAGPDFCGPCSEVAQEWVPWHRHGDEMRAHVERYRAAMVRATTRGIGGGIQ